MSNNLSTLESCRISGSSNLISVLSLGNQALTGVFPKNTSEDITVGPPGEEEKLRCLAQVMTFTLVKVAG